MAFAKIFSFLDERANLMGRMMETLGLRQKSCETVADGLELRRAAQNCMHCQSTGICQSWLDEQEIIGRTSEPTFCPNYRRFLKWQGSEEPGREKSAP